MMAERKNRMGREFQKPTDQRRGAEDPLSALSYAELAKKGKITEQVSVNGLMRVNIVIDGKPRTITLIPLTEEEE
jgi:hypothetical protein